MSMELLAIDIIFLFEEEINKKIITLSESIKNSNFVLGDSNKPHLSLCKFLIKEENLTKINLELNKLNIKTIELKVKDIKEGNIEYEKTTAILLELDLELLKLHNNIIKIIDPFAIDTKISTNMFFENVNMVTLKWSQKAVSNITRTLNPHISLGFGNLRENAFNLSSFKPKKLVISHMGNYCTSKEILTK